MLSQAVVTTIPVVLIGGHPQLLCEVPDDLKVVARHALWSLYWMREMSALKGVFQME